MKSGMVISAAGCDSSLTDFALLERYIRNNGYSLSKNIANADIIIIYTCGYTAEREEASINLIRKLIDKKKIAAKIIITGCLPAINRGRINRIFKGSMVTAGKLQDLDAILAAKVKLRDIKYINPPQLCRKRDDLGYFLRIGWGCLGECSYCAVKFVFAKIKSRPTDEILDEFNQAYIYGQRNFNLIAQDVGVYGRDCNTSLHRLIKLLNNLHDDCMFRLFNITPNRLKPLLVPLKRYICTGKIPMIVMPIQSGSNRILHLMRRGYSVSEIKGCVRKINEYNPGVIIKTDIIVGFPSETKDDFLQTLKLIEWLGRYGVTFQSFSYSKRINTEASSLKGQLKPQTKNKRLKQINRATNKYNLIGNKSLFNQLKRSQLAY